MGWANGAGLLQPAAAYPLFPWLLMYAAVAAMAKVAGQVELELMGASGGARATAGGYALATRTAERTRPEPHR